MSWSQQKERALHSQLAQAAQLQAERDAAVGDIVTLIERIRGEASSIDVCVKSPLEQTVFFVRAMIEHADRLRDLLEPFDSGVRPDYDEAAR